MLGLHYKIHPFLFQNLNTQRICLALSTLPFSNFPTATLHHRYGRDPMADVKDPSLIMEAKKWAYEEYHVIYSVHKREGLKLEIKDESIITFSTSTIESILRSERKSKQTPGLPLISHTFYVDNEYECVQIVALKDESPFPNADFLYWATGDKYITGTVIAPLGHFPFLGLPEELPELPQRGTFYEKIKEILPTMSPETKAQLAVKVQAPLG